MGKFENEDCNGPTSVHGRKFENEDCIGPTSVHELKPLPAYPTQTEMAFMVC